VIAQKKHSSFFYFPKKEKKRNGKIIRCGRCQKSCLGNPNQRREWKRSQLSSRRYKNQKQNVGVGNTGILGEKDGVERRQGDGKREKDT